MNSLFMDKKSEMLHGQEMNFYYTFKTFLDDQIKKYGGEAATADAMGVSNRSIYHWKVDGRQPQKKTIAKISRNLGVPIEDIVHWGQEKTIVVEDKEKQYFKGVPYLEAEPSGSEGEGMNMSKGVKSYLAFDSQWIHYKGSPKSMGVMRVSGPSMEPTLPDGSLVLVDMSQNDPAVGKVFIVEHCEGLQAKRLGQDDDGWILISDNKKEAAPIHVKPGNHFRILGKVLWVAYDVT